MRKYADLARVIGAWNDLPNPIRTAIMALLDAAGAPPAGSPTDVRHRRQSR
jgi:hypothetical protein